MTTGTQKTCPSLEPCQPGVGLVPAQSLAHLRVLRGHPRVEEPAVPGASVLADELGEAEGHVEIQGRQKLSRARLRCGVRRRKEERQECEGDKTWQRGADWQLRA